MRLWHIEVENMGAPPTGKSSEQKKESMAVTNTSTVEKLDSSNPKRKEGATIADAAITDETVLTAAQVGKFLSSKISPTTVLMLVLVYLVASPDLSGMCLP